MSTSDRAQSEPALPGRAARPRPASALRRRVEETTTLRVAVVVLAVCAVVFMLEYAQSVLVPITLAALLAMVLSPIVERLHSLYVPRSIGAAVAVLASCAGILLLANRLLGPAAEWLASIPQAMQRARWVFHNLVGLIRDFQETTAKVAEMSRDSGGGEQTEQVVVQGPNLAELVAAGTGQVVITLGLVLVLLYFMLLSGNLLLRKIVFVMPSFRRKRMTVRIAEALKIEVSRYLLTITAINLGLGCCTALAMWLLGMPDPMLWGALAAVLNFMPYLGAMVSAMAIFLAALLTFTQPFAVLLPPAVFLGLTTLEGNFVTPAILGQRLALNPIAVFLFLTLWGWVWGMPGMLIAVPLLVSIKIVSERVPSLFVIEELLSPRPPRCGPRAAVRRNGRPPA